MAFGERRTTFYSGVASYHFFKVTGYVLLINIHDIKKAFYTYQQLYFPGLFTAQR